MKKFFYFIFAATLMLGLASCGDDPTVDPVVGPEDPQEEAPVINLKKSSVVILDQGGVAWVDYTIENPVEGESLTYEAEADCWAEVDLTNEGSIKISAALNDTGAERTTEIVFSYKDAESVSLAVNQPAWEAPITLTVNAVEASKVNFTVATADPDLTWMPLMTTKEHFDSLGDDEAVFEDDMLYVSYAASEEGLSLQEYLSVLLQTGSMEGLVFSGLMPETEYVLYVYGLTSEGVRTTDIYSTVVTTAEPYDGDITFDIQVNEENHVMDITITPSHDGVAYYWNIMDKATYEEWGGSMPEAATALIEADIEEYLYWGDIYDRSEYYEWYSIMNTDNSQFESMADTEYIIYAFKWNENCEIEGEVAYVWHTTEKVEPSDNQITLEVSNPEQTSFSVNVTTTNDDPYVVLAEPADECLWNDMTDEEIFTYVMDYYGTWFITDYICYGDISDASFVGLDPDTEYSVVAFGYEAGVRTTAVERASITTLPGGDPMECTFEFEVIEARANTAYVAITPSDSSHWYYWMVYEASVTADEVKANILATLDEWYYGDMWEFSYYELSQGYSEGEVTMLSPNTEYKVAAVIMDDSTGDFLSDVHFSENFFTPEMVYADINVSCSVKAYYDGDLLAAASQEYALYAGYAMVPVTLEIEGEYAEFYYTMFVYEEGLENPELYPDETLYNGLYNGVYYATEMNFRAPWDEPVLLAAVALDYEGNYSHVYRQKVTFTKEGASPIDEIINATRSLVELKSSNTQLFRATEKKPIEVKRAEQSGDKRFSTQVIKQLKADNRTKVEAEKRELKKQELATRKANKANKVRNLRHLVR